MRIFFMIFRVCPRANHYHQKLVSVVVVGERDMKRKQKINGDDTFIASYSLIITTGLIVKYLWMEQKKNQKNW